MSLFGAHRLAEAPLISAAFETLRDPVKRWSRFRLATGCAFATISAGALALSRFSAFLAKRHPGITGEAGITRPVLEDYLSWLVTQGYSASTRALSLSMIRVFFDACHRHGWLAGLAANATIYVEELPFHHGQIALPGVVARRSRGSPILLGGSGWIEGEHHDRRPFSHRTSRVF